MATSENLITSSELFPDASRFPGYGTVGCALVEPDGRIVSVTRSFAALLDSEVGLFFGQSIFDLVTQDEDLEHCSLLLEGQKMRVLRSDGRSLSWSAYKIAPGAILGGYYVGLLWDERELEGLERRLVHRDRLASLGELTAGVAHEIAGPLNVIANNAELLLDEVGMTLGARQGLTTMRNEAFRLGGLLQDILGFARNAPPKIEGHDAVRLVRKSLDLFNQHLSGKKVSWRIEAESGLPPVGGEAEQLQQVFFNLFKNARDASPDCGEVVILVRRQSPRRPGAGIEFVILDKGEGIAASDLKHIGEPFFTTKPAGQGTGLGLAIVQRILAAHQGSLKLTSSPGEGTSAIVLLPVFFDAEASLLGV